MLPGWLSGPNLAFDLLLFLSLPRDIGPRGQARSSARHSVLLLYTERLATNFTFPPIALPFYFILFIDFLFSKGDSFLTPTNSIELLCNHVDLVSVV